MSKRAKTSSPARSSKSSRAKKKQRPTTVASSLCTPQRMERIGGWGMAHAADCYLYRPSSPEQVQELFHQATLQKRKVTLRGRGLSYGDASIGQEAVLLDCTRMNRILEWNANTGILEVEPGVRLAAIWQHIIEDGWWPPVVGGTMETTIAGAASMNIHGTNHFCEGPFGECILEFDLLTPQGELLTCNMRKNKSVYFAAIGSFGMLGCFTRFKLQMKRIHSGNLSVKTVAASSLQEMLEVFRNHQEHQHLVGWIDGFAKHEHLGRGYVQVAKHLDADEDTDAISSLRVRNQQLPKTLFGFLPRSAARHLLRPLLNRFCMRWVNRIRHMLGLRASTQAASRQKHVHFHFQLDSIPHWKQAYLPGGLVQYQCFVPNEHARVVFENLLRWAQEASFPPYLVTLRQHRDDRFLLSSGLNGYSLAMDFPVNRRNQTKLLQLTERMTDEVLTHQGRFHLAKDGLLTPQQMQQIWPRESIDRFRKLKRKLDPNRILESDLARRSELFVPTQHKRVALEKKKSPLAAYKLELSLEEESHLPRAEKTRATPSTEPNQTEPRTDKNDSPQPTSASNQEDNPPTPHVNQPENDSINATIPTSQDTTQSGDESNQKTSHSEPEPPPSSDEEVSRPQEPT